MRHPARWLLFALFTVFADARAIAQSASDRPLVIEELVCRGNASTSCTFILGQVYLAQGDPVDEEELQNAKLRLLWLRNFQTVSIYLEKGSERGKARLIVEVVEAKPVTTELAYAAFWQDKTFGQTLNGRLTHYNLFGSGKIFDARATAIMPFSGPTIRQYFARAQYIDPHLFDSKRNFFSAGASYLDNTLNRTNGDSIFSQQVSYDVTFGRRLWDFSYFTLGYQHRPVINLDATVRRSNGDLESFDRRRTDVLVWGFGWNSEDDPYFPTRGSRLEVSVLGLSSGGQSENDANIFYRRTWRWGRSVWNAYYQNDDIFGIGFARPLAPEFAEGALRRGRWFVGTRITPNGFTKSGNAIRDIGANAGILLETRQLGIVQFSVFYSRVLSQ